MKKSQMVFNSSLLSFCVAVSLFGCFSDTKLPQTSHEKVKFAFAGVEKSLKNSSSKTKRANNIQMEDNSTSRFGSNQKKEVKHNIDDDVLTSIYNAMSVEKETSSPSFEYNEPPMIQFQYLKALYEEVGDDFAFSTKYTYQMVGEIYYDFTSREVKQDEEHKYNYTFDLSVKLDIDDNDLITAAVGFELVYRQGVEERRQVRYAELILDYDMDEVEPTYTLSMVDIDNLLSYQDDDEKYINAEYDYVKVEKNTIQEWRKFGICSPEELSHYENSDFVYKYSVLRGYKNNKLYHLENTYLKDAVLKENVIEKLGLLEVINSSTAFRSESGTQNAKIQVVVNKFNDIYGNDIVNSLVYTGASEKWTREDQQGDENIFLKVESTSDTIIYDDIKIADLFDSNKGWTNKGRKEYLTISLKQGEENTLATYNDFSSLNVRVRSTAYDKTEWIDVNDNGNALFTDYVKESGFIGSYSPDGMDYNAMISLVFDITLKTNPNVKLQNPLTIDLINQDSYTSLLKNWNLTSEYINAYAPIKDVIPEVEGDVLYSPNISSDGKKGKIGLHSSNLSSELNTYISDLKKAGYVGNSTNNVYSKRIADNYILALTVYMPSGKESLTDSSIAFEFKESIAPQESITQALTTIIGNSKISIPEFVGEYEYQVNGNLISIQTNETDLVGSYINSFADHGFLVYTYLDTEAAVKYVDGVIYRIRNLGRSILVEKASTVLSLVGDFIDWAVTDPSYDFETLIIRNNRLCFVQEMNITAVTSFKVVKNHSLDGGGYGFGLVDNSIGYEWISSGENDNIVINQDGNYKINAEFDLIITSENIDENSLIVIVIDIERIAEN